MTRAQTLKSVLGGVLRSVLQGRTSAFELRLSCEITRAQQLALKAKLAVKAQLALKAQQQG